MEENTKKDIRCAVCGKEFVALELNKNNCNECPNCKTTIPPVKICEDGYVYLNWQEIRVLAIYAQRWVKKFDLSNKGNKDAVQVLVNILKKLSSYQPKTSNQNLEDVQVEVKEEKGIKSPYYLR